MVSVLVVRPFSHRGIDVLGGQFIEMEPIEAAVKAREGLVSLLHGNTYQTREMVAEAPVHAVMVQSVVAPAPTEDPVADTTPKRRRGRPRKSV